MLQCLAEPLSSPVSANARRTLVIDLEGALLRSELLIEALFSACVHRLPACVRADRAHGGADRYAGARRARLRPPSLRSRSNEPGAGGARSAEDLSRRQPLSRHAAAIALISVLTASSHRPISLRGDKSRCRSNRHFRACGARVGRREIDWRIWAKALRVYQYAKNTLVFVPVITAHQIVLRRAAPRCWRSWRSRPVRQAPI